jgi:hypothetical protein
MHSAHLTEIEKQAKAENSLVKHCWVCSKGRKDLLSQCAAEALEVAVVAGLEVEKEQFVAAGLEVLSCLRDY